MKANIHPKYHQATISCTGCNTVFQAGSTSDSIRVDICSNCHPFYTGQKKLIDTEGRVERFERRAQTTHKAKPKKALAQPVFASASSKKAVQPLESQPKTSDRPKTLREMLQEAANNS